MGVKTELNAKSDSIQGHSRSCILGSVKTRRRTAYRYNNNAGFISKVSEEISSEHAIIRINLISPEIRLIGLHFALVSMGLSSFNFL